MLKKIRNSILYTVLVFTQHFTMAQVCTKDSNFYSISYHRAGDNLVKDAVLTSDNEVVALCQYEPFSTFITKFTGQGSIIWSNEFKTNYPHDTWVQYPWYNMTEMIGIITRPDGSYYTYGSAYEHGKSINNVEDPPGHRVGLIFNIDKYGNKISGKYFGNWRTDYTVNNLLQLSDGNLIVYLRSHRFPKISKVLCINIAGDILWAAPIQSNSLIYTEIDQVNPVMQQLSNGNIVVAQIIQRDVADTIWYPFQPPIILPAPLHYFNLFELNGKDGRLVWENSYQCPTLTNSNVANTFIPQIKNITQLPNGNLSFLADMYLPLDSSERFYANKVYSKRAANFITTNEGFNLKLISYYPENGACDLENAKATGNNGEQLLLTKDSATGKSILFKINSTGQIIWSNSYSNTNNAGSSQNFALEKNQGKGYFILQGSTNSPDINLTITNAKGNTSCTQLPVTMVIKNGVWPWLVNKVHLENTLINIDFRYSPFAIKQNTYPLLQHIGCQYQYVCCTDFIDSLRPNKISICENETYKLPDNSIVKDSGLYYATLKTQRGCDSILFYNVNILKSPAHLTTTPDTCLKNANTILLRASEGYDSYLWNNSVITNQSYFSVHSPGTYSVKIENKCGIKTDTIHVYPDCDFPIYFPNAFTPNKDFLNDILKVPELNKNKFNCLTIYNRYGHIVFKTVNVKDGWDGNFKGLEQDNGVYTYLLEMVGFSGKRINQKGNIVLIR